MSTGLVVIGTITSAASSLLGGFGAGLVVTGGGNFSLSSVDQIKKNYCDEEQWKTH
jgi:hypothetical protein